MSNLPISSASTSTSTSTQNDWYSRYQRWRRLVEPVFWVLFFCAQAALNSITAGLDHTRLALATAPWETALWEWSSNLVLLALMPFVVAMHRRYTLRLKQFRPHFLVHVAATVVYCLVHVVAMVAIRKLGYQLNGAHYDFGHWPTELIYEYLKDFRSYAGVLLVLTCYELLLTRMQGEANLLSAPDVGKPEGSIERPERFLVKKLGKEFLLPANEVEYLQAMGNYVNLHVRGKDYPLRSTMTEIEARFDPTKFVRVHRSYIVNLDAIEQIEPLDSGDARARLKTGAEVPISRRYRDALRGRFGT